MRTCLFRCLFDSIMQLRQLFNCPLFSPLLKSVYISPYRNRMLFLPYSWSCQPPPAFIHYSPCTLLAHGVVHVDMYVFICCTCVKSKLPCRYQCCISERTQQNQWKHLNKMLYNYKSIKHLTSCSYVPLTQSLLIYKRLLSLCRLPFSFFFSALKISALCYGYYSSWKKHSKVW